MPSADKRARKKENARAAREQREAATKRKKQIRSAITVGVAVAIFAGVIVLLNVTGGGSKKKATPPAATVTTKAAPTTTTIDPKTLDKTKLYTATIKTNFGTIELQMDVKKAPIGAAHFMSLARNGVYNGSRWHRIIKGFVIQGGAPHGDPSQPFGQSVVGELPKGGKYALGDVAAAENVQTSANGTFDSQFFIVTGPQGEALQDQYADFAHVTSGLDVVKKIEALKTDTADNPVKPATIASITITQS